MRWLGVMLVVTFASTVLHSHRASAQSYDEYGNPIDGQPVAAQPDQMSYGFVGAHPEPYEYGSQPCYQQGPHFHPYAPFDQYLFREANGYFYFVGDLGDFSYTGQLWGYQGNHPIPPEFGGGYCYIDWQHRHHFPAPASMPFRYIGGYYSYYGTWDPGYYRYRNQWTGYYNGYYRNSYYGGRYWSVRPQPIYRPSYGWGSRGVYRPGMTVIAPGGARISVGGWGGHPGHVGHPGYAPAPSRPAYAPAPAPAPRPQQYAPAPAARPAPGPAPAPMNNDTRRHPGGGMVAPPPR